VAPVTVVLSASLSVRPGWRGIEVRLNIAAKRMAGLQLRRRTLASRTGFGLCGVDSLEEAMRPVAVSQATEVVSRQAIWQAMTALPSQQRINRLNRAAHAAGWAAADGTLVAVREDVDKLGGALARSRKATPGGFVVVTSHCSYAHFHFVR
jgi:formate dehydrogenase assembly factor FdhD